MNCPIWTLRIDILSCSWRSVRDLGGQNGQRYRCSTAALMKIAQNGDLLWKYEYRAGGERADFQKIAAGNRRFRRCRLFGKKRRRRHLCRPRRFRRSPARYRMLSGFRRFDGKRRFPQVEPFTPGTQGGFCSAHVLVVGSDVLPGSMNIAPRSTSVFRFQTPVYVRGNA